MEEEKDQKNLVNLLELQASVTHVLGRLDQRHAFHCLLGRMKMHVHLGRARKQKGSAAKEQEVTGCFRRTYLLEADQHLHSGARGL